MLRPEDLDPRLMAIARWRGWRVHLAPPEDIHQIMVGEGGETFSGSMYDGLARYSTQEILVSSSLDPDLANETLAHEVGHVLAGINITWPMNSVQGRWQYFRAEVKGFERAMHVIGHMWPPERVAGYAERQAAGFRTYQVLLFPGFEDFKFGLGEP